MAGQQCHLDGNFFFSFIIAVCVKELKRPLTQNNLVNFDLMSSCKMHSNQKKEENEVWKKVFDYM